ncbi:Protein DA1-related 2 [Linum perenne]
MASSNSSSAVTHISNPCVYGDFVEKKSRLAKWLSKLFKTSSHRDGGGGGSSVGSRRHPQLLGDENMLWRGPSARSLGSTQGQRPRADKEKEELDRAIALSLSEDLRRPNGGYGWRPAANNNDEGALARAQQDNLNLSSYPPPYAIPPPPHYYPRGYRLCGGCHREIGYGNYLGCMGMFFHPECFRCHSCAYPITETEFSLSGKDPYHKSCFKELTHPKCEVCLQFIPTNSAGLIEYRCHPFWSQKYCPCHEHDGTARCCSCERLEVLLVMKSWTARYYTLEDGRSLCMECMESAIMDTGDCQPLYHAIRDYYEGMNMRGYHHMPETRGLCLSEEQTVTSVQRRPRIGGHRLVGMRTQPQKLIRRCEVTAILVLYGLPRLLTGAILAHELMHGWLRLKGYRNLNPEVEEGICQVLSYMWLESEVFSSYSSSKKGGRSEVENKLGEFFMHQIAHDASPAYGGGFRSANKAVNKYGLRRTLDHIRLTGNFPL